MVPVPVCDLSLLLGLWEVRVTKQNQRHKREQERKERSALSRIEQQWQYRIYCRAMKIDQKHLGQHTEVTCGGSELDKVSGQQDPEKGLTFQLEGCQWTDFPRDLQWKTYLQHWHVKATKIRKLPDFLSSFTQLKVLQLPKNLFTDLPPEIGKLSQLQHLDVSFNLLSSVPLELGLLEDLKTLDLAGNRLRELPFEGPEDTGPGGEPTERTAPQAQ